MPVCRTACPYDCPDGCSLLATVEEGRVVQVTGDPANPYTGGLVCAKLARFPQSVNSPHRLTVPLRRTGPKGSGQFAPISWEEAIREIAEHWKALIAAHGPECILPYSYAGTMGAVQRSCGEGFFHALGACRLERTICSSAKSVAWASVMGNSCDLSPFDLEHSDLCLIWGSNLPATRLHLLPILKRAKARGQKLILLDVYESPSADLADQVLLLRPGSDGALALALLHVLDREGLTDEAWLAAHTTGWPALKAALSSYPPEWAAPITGLEPDVIRNLAREYGRAAAPVILAGSGFTRLGNGGENARALLCLPAAVGAWAKRGGGTYGFCSSPTLVDKNPVRRPDLGGGRLVNINQLGQALEGDSIRSLYIYHANPAAVTSDQNAILRGLAREDLFTVVHERFLTDTARYADLLLPATFMTEQEDLFTPYGYRSIQYVQPVSRAPGACKSNLEVFRLLSAALGLADPWAGRTAGELCRAMVEDSPRLSREEKDRVLAGEPVVQPGPFPLPVETGDGKIHLADPEPPAWKPPHGGPEPLCLVCAPAVHTLNSTFNEVPELCRLRGEMTLRLNAADAAARGIHHGDAVTAENELGRVVFTAALDRAVAPGAAVAEGVFPGEGTVNALTHQRLSDLARATTMNDNTVEVRL